MRLRSHWTNPLMIRYGGIARPPTADLSRAHFFFVLLRTGLAPRGLLRAFLLRRHLRAGTARFGQTDRNGLLAARHLLPERPLRKVPRLRSCIALFTFLPAFFPYRAMLANSVMNLRSVQHESRPADRRAYVRHQVRRARCQCD